MYVSQNFPKAVCADNEHQKSMKSRKVLIITLAD